MIYFLEYHFEESEIVGIGPLMRVDETLRVKIYFVLYLKGYAVEIAESILLMDMQEEKKSKFENFKNLHIQLVDWWAFDKTIRNFPEETE